MSSKAKFHQKLVFTEFEIVLEPPEFDNTEDEDSCDESEEEKTDVESTKYAIYFRYKRFKGHERFKQITRIKQKDLESNPFRIFLRQVPSSPFTMNNDTKSDYKKFKKIIADIAKSSNFIAKLNMTISYTVTDNQTGTQQQQRNVSLDWMFSSSIQTWSLIKFIQAIKKEQPSIPEYQDVMFIYIYSCIPFPISFSFCECAQQ